MWQKYSCVVTSGRWSPTALPWDAATLAYARAVREMQSRPDDDPTS
jgi:hypothetical protein